MKYLPIPEFNDEDCFHICKFIEWPDDDRIDTDCWLWTGATDNKGYGTVWLSDGKKYRVHRVICAWNLGDNPDLEAGHAPHDICGHTNCLAYHHLSWQTHTDNQRQRRIDGTHLNVGRLCGERHGMAKLTDSQVEEIKKKYATGKYSYRELGKEYDVAHSSISDYVNGKRRKNC